jgi:hypothetical protein
MNDFWINFFANFFSDLLIGAGLGFFLAWWLNKIQQKEADIAEKKQLEDERQARKKRILELIYNELEANQKLLRQVSHREGIEANLDECYIVAHKLKNELWLAFSDGGELEWINNVGLVDTLAQAYFSIKTVQYSGRSYFQSRYLDEPKYGPVVAEHVGKFLNENVAASITDIHNALAYIEGELPGLKKESR